MGRAIVILCGAVLLYAAALEAAPADWSRPFPPHKIAGNLYYVGTADLASYLFTTPAGDILINPSFESSVPLIQKSFEQLGFKFSDIKVILISHAHNDHAGGSALAKKLTGAKLMVMDADVPEIEGGGKGDFNYAQYHWTGAKVDRVLHDGDIVELGGTKLVAHLTPGHTKGCTTWTTQLNDGGRTLNVVIVGSPNVNPGYKLVDNAQYPQIAQDYEKTFRVLKSLPCDVFLGAHGSYYGLQAKYEKAKAGGTNPFIDPAGYKAYIDEREQAFRKELNRQQHAASSGGR